jgi:hypothetical protein
MTHKDRVLITRAKVHQLPRRGWLECERCGTCWAYRSAPGTPRPSDWWRCPNGCNDEAKPNR